MKSSILITHILRVLETEGAVGDGAPLALAYAEAVRKVNERLERVIVAEEAKQLSDAVRLMAEPPQLIDEVSTLDFERLPDWKIICSRRGWAIPQTLNRTLIDRALRINGSEETVEPMLNLYRKAMRTANDELALQALRRLVKLDSSTDWQKHFEQCEKKVQHKLMERFRQARFSVQPEEAERVAFELVDGDWAKPPSGQWIAEVNEYLEGIRAQRREREGRENLELLGRCLTERWDHDLACSMVNAIDRLVAQGWRIPVEQSATVVQCRRRCEEENRLAKLDCRWRELCEALHGAVEREDAARVRELCADPVFLERRPEAELLARAQQVVQVADATRRRKLLLIAVCSLVALLGVLGISFYAIEQQKFEERCQREVELLESLATGPAATVRLDGELRRLDAEAHEVWSDPRVNVYVARLETLRSQEVARVGELTRAVSGLQELQRERWPGGEMVVTSRLAKVETLLQPDDDAEWEKFLAVRKAWEDHLVAEAQRQRVSAEAAYVTITQQLVVLTQRLKSEVGSDALAADCARCRTEVDTWYAANSSLASSCATALTGLVKPFAEAEMRQRQLMSAIGNLRSATTLLGIMSSRMTLLSTYSDYPFVQLMGEVDATYEDAVQIVEGKSPEQVAFAQYLAPAIDDNGFRQFLQQNILALKSIPAYYSLFGIYAKEDNQEYYAYVCKGRPTIRRPRSEDGCYILIGDLVDTMNCRMPQQGTMRTAWTIHTEQLPATDEICELVADAESGNYGAVKLERKLLALIDAHIQAARAPNFLAQEQARDRLVRNWFPAIRRVQCMYAYFRWLGEELKVTPEDPAIAQWLQEVGQLGQPVSIDGVDDELTWTLMNDRRIRKRNQECAELLSRMPTTFVADWKRWRNAKISCRKFSGMTVSLAGMTDYCPENPYWRKDPTSVFPKAFDGVQVDHPLYVLRKQLDRWVFLRALEPDDNGWKLVDGMKGKIRSGEPLYQFRLQGGFVDPEAEATKLLHGLPAVLAKQIADKLPHLQIKVK